jgi:hypothetical protein
MVRWQRSCIQGWCRGATLDPRDQFGKCSSSSIYRSLNCFDLHELCSINSVCRLRHQKRPWHFRPSLTRLQKIFESKLNIAK